MDFLIQKPGRVLLTIGDNEGCLSCNGISRKLNSPSSYTNTLINELLELDLVYKVRSTKDKRNNFLKLTEKGDKIYKNLVKIKNGYNL